MAYCKYCGKEIKDYKYCPNCGKKIDDNVEDKNKLVKKEIEVKEKIMVTREEKVFGVLSYLGIFAFLPYFSSSKSKFVKFHSIQGMNLFLLDIFYMIIGGLLSLIKVKKTVILFNGLSAIKMVTPWFIGIPLIMFGMMLIILSIIGIVNVLNSKKEKLPIVEKIKILN